MIFERDHEIQAIDAALSSALAGAGEAMLVAGPAGIGKTRLLQYAREKGSGAGMMALEARAGEFEGAYGWGVVRQLFTPGAKVRGSIRDVSGAARLALPALGLDPALEPNVPDSFSIIHGLFWLTAELTREAPLLIAIDDLHWADLPSLKFVAHLARRLEGLPILLALAMREPGSGAASDQPLLDGIAVEPSVCLLQPGALGVSACSELTTAALGSAPSTGFAIACHEVTGGNPFLLNALLADLAAEGISGTDVDTDHVRRMTPASVSRRVLLTLGRMPAPALALARAVTVLGTSATLGRACKLAQVRRPTGVATIAALIAESLIEGDDELRFVHPLVRSAVHSDFAAPQLQQWHERAARILAAEEAPLEQIAVHLLASGKRGDAWSVEMLRRAAIDARERGVPDLAVLYLDRALVEGSRRHERADLLFELGSVELHVAPARAVEHLDEAHRLTHDPDGRAAIALALAQGHAIRGDLGAAVSLVERSIAEDQPADTELGRALLAALLNLARWDLSTRLRTRPLLETLGRRAENGDVLDPLLCAMLAIELSAAGKDRKRAVAHIQLALRSSGRLIAPGSSLMPEAVSVLLFADRQAEALRAVDGWLRPVQERGWQLASATAATCAALINLYGGAVSEAISWARHALEHGADALLSPIATAFLVLALIERGDLEQARAELTERGLDGELPPSWPHNVLRHARGCLHSAAGEYQLAVEDLLGAGERAEQWGIRNPAMMDWRSAAALSMHALGESGEARRLCATELELARRWGAPRALGVALRRAGVVTGRARGMEQLASAVDVLRGAPAPLELAHALSAQGIALRHAGRRGDARAPLRAALDLAHRHGGLALAERTRAELVVAGGRPRRDALRGRDALTPSELRVASMAAAGHTNRQIAQSLFITQRTVELHLTSSYAKLDIGSRQQIPTALESG